MHFGELYFIDCFFHDYRAQPPGGNKKGGKNAKNQGMKTGKNFVKGNKGPRPLMSLCPGPGPRGPPGFMVSIANFI